MLCLLLGLAHALEPAVPLAERVAVAESIVVAEVSSTEARWSVDHPGDIETVVWLHVEEVHKGAHSDTLEILVDGGQIGAERTHVSTQPTLMEDHRYLLFLVRDFEGRRRVLGNVGTHELPSLAPAAWAGNGNDWSWEPNPVSDGFEINADGFPDPDGTEAAWQMALTIWNAEGMARIYLPDRGRTDNNTYGGGDDGHNVTMYTPQTWSSALAQSRYNSSGDEMIDCDTEFYGANSFGPKDWSVDPAGAAEGAYDFAHTAVHELGHCLGLSHSTDGGAIMQSTNSSGTGWERRHLGDDDVAGLQALYGAGAPALELALTLVDADGDGVGTPDELFTLEVEVHNAGQAPSVDVQGVITGRGPIVLTADASDIGDLPPGASRGTTAAAMAFEFVILPDCDETVGEIEVSVSDLAGGLVTETVAFDVDCWNLGGAGPEDPDVAGEAAARCCSAYWRAAERVRPGA